MGRAFDAGDATERDVSPGRGRSLAWLWVLIVSTFVGFGIGGSATFFWNNKEHPPIETAENSSPEQLQAPISNKQEVAPSTQKAGPSQKVGPEKQESGSSKDVNSTKQEVVPPKQPDQPAPPKVQDNERLAPATAFPGLKFYLNCDALTDGSLTDSVSGKLVGKGAKLELVDGMRGKAIRISHEPTDGSQHGLDLSTAAESLGIDANKPFTLAFWLRRAFFREGYRFGSLPPGGDHYEARSAIPIFQNSNASKCTPALVRQPY